MTWVNLFSFIIRKLNEFCVFHTLYVEVCRSLDNKTTQIACPPVFYGKHYNVFLSVAVDMESTQTARKNKTFETTNVSLLYHILPFEVPSGTYF